MKRILRHLTWMLSMLLILAAALAQDPELPRADKKPAEAPPERASDEHILKNAKIGTTPEELSAFLRHRTLPDHERPIVAGLIRQLGSPVHRDREKASRELIGRGPVVAEMLRAALTDSELEIALRAERCLRRIQEVDVAVEVPAAAVRLLTRQKPKNAVETLLNFLPFADNDHVGDEVRNALAGLAVEGGKAHPLLFAGLSDKLPARRAAAGEALIRAAFADHKDALKKMLADPDPGVRLRVGLALAYAKEKDAVGAVIDALPHLSMQQAWQAEDLLFRLAEGKTPPSVSLGSDDEGRKKCRDAWAQWWREHQANVDLAKLKEVAPLQGYTLVVLLDQNKVMELGTDNQPRWQIDNLIFPLDAQYLPGDRVLIAEYHAARVTERNTKGEVLWQKRLSGGPLVAQRLPNGNTFIATDSQLLEYDRAGKEILSANLPERRIMKAMKLPNGEIACLTSDARVVRLDPHGKELFGFTVSLGMRLFGGRIHMLPSGRVLVPQNAENKVVEYDARGKAVWEVAIEQPVAAVRLPNGNTLVTTMLPERGAVEFDRQGKEIWSYQTKGSSRVTRAMRR